MLLGGNCRSVAAGFASPFVLHCTAAGVLLGLFSACRGCRAGGVAAYVHCVHSAATRPTAWPELSVITQILSPSTGRTERQREVDVQLVTGIARCVMTILLAGVAGE